MKKMKKVIFILSVMVVSVFSGVSALAASLVESVPYASDTGSVKETKSKTLTSSKGNLKISYTISGLYIYDINSGAITSAYGTKLVETSIIQPPEPHDGDWELIIEDLVCGTPTVAPDGSSAKYPVRFHVYARFVPGGVGLWERIDFGIVNDYIMAYAK